MTTAVRRFNFASHVPARFGVACLADEHVHSRPNEEVLSAESDAGGSAHQEGEAVRALLVGRVIVGQNVYDFFAPTPDGGVARERHNPDAAGVCSSRTGSPGPDSGKEPSAAACEPSFQDSLHG